MQYFSFHTHSDFCDGKASVEEVCEKAIELGLGAVGFSSHAPVAFETTWAMNFHKMDSYVKEVERCRLKYKDQLEVYRSLETDFIAPGKSIPFDEYRALGQLDYIIGSVHLVANPQSQQGLWFLDGPVENYEKGLNTCFNGDAVAAVQQYYSQIQEMVRTQKPDVIAHMDKVVMNNKNRFFTEEDAWYQDVVEETLQVIAKSESIVEINTRGIYRGKYHTWFPNERIIKRCVDLNIPLTVSVDAHHPDELIAGFEEAVLALQKMGCRYLSVFTELGWEQKGISAVLF
ncbi:histidinol-phosphatase [Carboxylicivirga sp. M1479]|uniref:histidinol-phosphatase n=1 Tax=Carboxylicivirga sp. M1479 TaxID=2594476 RepID=UPI001177F87D|nr:histidinol-phosphatase [Carboxylicivirga sp. M1479]TRX70324.1 histidinol-phosphatase [Carboxylicivirga sp. M1479]